jgi:hypothetical protein
VTDKKQQLSSGSKQGKLLFKTLFLSAALTVAIRSIK